MVRCTCASNSIEQALCSCGVAVDSEGYVVACAVAEDNLRLGRPVIADPVNPWPLTRDAWRSVASRAGAPVIEIEIICSDTPEHRRRVRETCERCARPDAADVVRGD